MASYSRDLAVTAIHDFYKFLSSMGAIPESSILIPPSTGWPDINSTTLEALGKDEEVIELLRHIPYIADNVEGDGNREIAFETSPFDYTGVTVNGSSLKWILDTNALEGSLIPVDAGDIPSYVAVLTMGTRYGSYLLLDTQQGTLTDYIQQERPEREEPPLGSPDYWRAYQTLPVAEFLKRWAENFRSLKWVALPHRPDNGILIQENSAKIEEIRDIYRAHGWPDGFRREECKQALYEWDQNR